MGYFKKYIVSFIQIMVCNVLAMFGLFEFLGMMQFYINPYVGLLLFACMGFTAVIIASDVCKIISMDVAMAYISKNIDDIVLGYTKTTGDSTKKCEGSEVKDETKMGTH